MSKTINNLSKDLKDLMNHFDLVDYDGSAESVDEIFNNKFTALQNEVTIIDNDLSITENDKYSIIRSHEIEFDCEQDGMTDNIYMEGLSLRNLVIGEKDDVAVWDGNRLALNMIDVRCTQGVYTIFNFTNKTIVHDICNESTHQYIRTFAVDAYQSKVYTLNAGEMIANINALFTGGWVNTDSDRHDLANRVVIVKGDYLGKVRYAFKGLCSVGQYTKGYKQTDDKIDLVTINTTNDVTNELLRNVTWTRDQYLECHEISGYYGTMVSAVEISFSNEFIPVEANTIYCFNDINHNLSFYDSNKNIIRREQVHQYNGITGYKDIYSNGLYTLDTRDNVKFVKITAITHKVDDIRIYKASKVSKSSVYTRLRGIPGGKYDTIEQINGRYCIVRRCEELTIDGDLPVVATEQVTTGHDYNIFNIYVDLGDSPISIISDKFNTIVSSGKSEGILYDHSNKRIRVSTNKANSYSEFNVWCRNNGLSIIYERKVPEIIEIQDLDLRTDTFAGKTKLIANTYVINTDMNFEVTNSIGSMLAVLKEKVTANSLQNNSYKDLTSKITFLNGFGLWHITRYDAYIANGMVTINMLICPPPSGSPNYEVAFKIDSRYAPLTRTYITCLTNNEKIKLGVLDYKGYFALEQSVGAGECTYLTISLCYPVRI